MPNIMITDVCNLHCLYCFANEFVNHDANEISMESFHSALDFIVKDGICKTVGLIGGEPTLHSQFREILRAIIDDERVEGATLYTNGICVKECIFELSHRKFHILINCNSPADIGDAAYKKMRDNIAFMVNEMYMRDRITLGINVYSDSMDFEYFIALLKDFGFKKARVSITVPNTDTKRCMNATTYFLTMKSAMKRLFSSLLENGIMPYYDCNKMPSCCISDEDIKEVVQGVNIDEMLSSPQLRAGEDVAINTPVVHCAPVIDILQDLSAVRCFGLSDVTKVHISDFRNIAELRNYYMGSIDCFAHATSYSSKCADCRHRKNLECYGGCLAFKISEIIELRTFAEKKIKRQCE